MNIHKKLKPKMAILISLILTIVICITSFILMNTSLKINDNSKQLSASIETQWRDYTKSILQDLEKKILFSINGGELDPFNEKELNDYVIDNLPLSTDGVVVNNFAIVNIGYKVRDQSLDLQLNFLEGRLDEGNEQTILNSYNSILQDIHTKGIPEIMSRINEESEQLSKQFNYISSDVFKKMFMDATLFDENIVSTSNVKLDQIEEIYKEDCWTESIVIPNGILGFNEEPPYLNNQKNPMYKKVAIYVSVDKDRIMEDYLIYQNNTEKLVNLSICLLVLMTVFCIFIIAILFVNVIKMNGGVYDAAYSNESCNSNNTDSVHIDGSRTK